MKTDRYEVELSFWSGEGTDDSILVVPFEASCLSEVVLKAYEIARDQKATYYSFGPVVPRLPDGSVDYRDPSKKR